MPDMRVLIAGLDAYRMAVDHQVDTVRDGFLEVERAWRLLDECFRGDAADEFRPIWLQTERRFREYVERTTVLTRVLGVSIDDLRRANLPTGLSG